MPRRINIDLDHVVADFETHYKTIAGKDNPWDNSKPALERWAPLVGHEEGFFLNLPIFTGAVEFVRELTNLGHSLGWEVRFLTAIPRLMPFPTAAQEKRQWVIDKLGSQLEVIIGPYAQDKAKHCQPGDILIDDNHLNIGQWREAGGFGVLHTSDLSESLNAVKNYLKKEFPNG